MHEARQKTFFFDSDLLNRCGNLSGSVQARTGTRCAGPPGEIPAMPGDRPRHCETDRALTLPDRLPQRFSRSESKKTFSGVLSCMPNFPAGRGGMDDIAKAANLTMRRDGRPRRLRSVISWMIALRSMDSNFDGAAADYIPELSKANPAHFGCRVGNARWSCPCGRRLRCRVHHSIDFEGFRIALALELVGAERVERRSRGAER